MDSPILFDNDGDSKRSRSISKLSNSSAEDVNFLASTNSNSGDSRLMYATNGSGTGIVLISQHGNMTFSAEEFKYYQCLFKLTDTSDMGKLNIGSLPFRGILRRTYLSSESLDILVTIALNSFTSKTGKKYEFVDNDDKNEVLNTVNNKSNNGNDVHSNEMISNETSNLEGRLLDDMFNNCINNNDAATIEDSDDIASLSLHQWLILCKMVGHLQQNPSVTLDNSLLEVITHIHGNNNEDNKDKFQFSSTKGTKRSNCHESNTVIDNHSSNGISNVCMNNSNDVENLFANFHMGVPTLFPISTGTIMDSKVCGWELSNEGFQRSHIKFFIRTVCSDREIDATDTNNGNYDNRYNNIKASASFDNSCERKNYKGLCNRDNNDMISPFGDSDICSPISGFGNKSLPNPHTTDMVVDTTNNAIVDIKISIANDPTFINNCMAHNNALVDFPSDVFVGDSSGHTEMKNGTSTKNAIINREYLITANTVDSKVSPSSSHVKNGIHAMQNKLISDFNDDIVPLSIHLQLPTTSSLAVVPHVSAQSIHADQKKDLSSIDSSKSLKDFNDMNSTNRIIQSNGSIEGVFPLVKTPTITMNKKKKKKRSNSNLGLNITNPIPTHGTTPIDISNSNSTSSKSGSYSVDLNATLQPIVNTPLIPTSTHSPLISTPFDPTKNGNISENDMDISDHDGNTQSLDDRGTVDITHISHPFHTNPLETINSVYIPYSPLQSVDMSRDSSPLTEHKPNNTISYKQQNISESSRQNEKNPLEYESYRRYSDFEILIVILQKLYKGVILPPLPPKTWASQLRKQTQSSEVFSHQRQDELQLFLNTILSHPVLKYSHELRMFLTCSKVGLNSFRNILPVLNFNRHGQVYLNLCI